MPKIPVVKAKDFLKYLLRYGCNLISIKGSHHKVINTLNGQISIVPIHSNKDLAPPLLAKILRDLEIDVNDFLDFMSNN